MTLKRSRPVLRGLVGSNAHLATRLTFSVKPPYALVAAEMTEESQWRGEGDRSEQDEVPR